MSTSIFSQSDYSLTYLNSEDGLAADRCFAVTMDSRGFIWVGTQFGLSRFDGLTFKNYLPDQTDSLALQEDVVNGIHERKDGKFWISTRFCLYEFDPVKEEFSPTSLKLENKNGEFEFFEFYAESDSIVWIGGKGGLFMYDSKKNIYEIYAFDKSATNSREQFDKNSIAYIYSYPDSKDTLLISKKNLWVFDKIKKKFSEIDPRDIKATTILKNNDGYWMTTDNYSGLIEYNWQSKKLKSLDENKDITLLGLQKTADNKLIYGSWANGFFLYDLKTKNIENIKHNESTISDFDYVTDIFCDPNGLIWAISWGGLIKIDPIKKNIPSILPPKPDFIDANNYCIRNAIQINDGEYLITSNQKEYVLIYNEKYDSFRHVAFENNDNQKLKFSRCTDLVKDKEGRIFLFSGVPFIFDQESETIRPFKGKKYIDEIGRGLLWESCITHDNQIIVADAHRGIVIYNPITDSFKRILAKTIETDTIDKRAQVTKAFVNSDNVMFLSTDAYGTYKYDTGKNRFLPRIKHILNQGDTIKGQFKYWLQYKSNYIVSGNFGIYLADENGSILQEIKNKNGRSFNYIYDIGSLKNEDFIALTNEGLYHFDQSLSSVSYHIEDGIKDLYGWSTYFDIMDSDKVFIGKKNSTFNLFDMHDLPKNVFVPPIVLTDIHFIGDTAILDKQLDYLDDIELNYSQNFFSIDFRALNYTDTKDNQYKYQLVGLHDKWVDNGNNTSATFTNLNPGNYTFKVIGSNNDGIWNMEGRSLDIVINPPWYQSWWAYLIYAILTIGSIFMYINYRRKKWLLANQLISEQKEAERLKELDETKNKIYTNITHEFLTPLTVIKGLNARNNGNDIIKAKIDDNSSELLNLVNQILALSKMESGHIKYEPVLIDIIPFLNYLVESHSSASQQKSINLNFYSEIQHLEMDVDHEKLKTTVVNLIANAIKYTPTYGKIIVIAKIENEGQLQIIVQDNGIGISEKQIVHIFDRFYQIDKKSEGGAGIGLSIVKEYSKLMKGTVTVESTVQKGSAFILSLPIQKTAMTTLQLNELQQTKSTIQFNELANEENTELTSSENQTILIIEDNHDVAFYIKEILKKEYNCIHKINGKEGLKAAMEIIPDVIISDVMMPQMDGIEMSQLLKNDIQTSHIPIILLTAKTRQDDMLAGLKAGADAYLTKPFNEQELLLRIEGILESRKKIQAYYSQHQTIPQSTSKDHAFVEKIKEVIKENMANENLSINDICRAVNLERTQVFRKLKALTGQSASVMIKELRLQKAKELLLDDKKNVSEIAYECGFKEVSYFTKVYKKHYGKVPSKEE